MQIRTASLFASAVGLMIAAAGQTQVATTVDDFEMPGTQPSTLTTPIVSAQACEFCHAFYDPDEEPYERWSGSMMANSMRDPVFHAALAIANQDAADSGELCLRCHAPGGWLAGRSTPADGSAMTGSDYEGVNCNFCHRMVDPIADAENPSTDPTILAGLSLPPSDAHSGQYVVDPDDFRRGPFDLGGGFLWHDWHESPFHQEALMCATCHDVSNPAFTRNGGATPAASDSYDLNTLDDPHPDAEDKAEMFPVERTFTEWSLSDFAVAPIDMGGRFGGNKAEVSTCQDCHMPDTTGTACMDGLGGVMRTDLPLHDFNGANTWVPEAIYRLDQSLELYGGDEVNDQPLYVFEDAVARNISMLQRACDLSVTFDGPNIVCTIVNQTGHKLPTGYGEGRRMWINVQYLNQSGQIMKEYGYYDSATAELDAASTKVYEIKQGLDANQAAATGLSAGPSFHFVLNNKIYKDNRIPPRGFDNAAFEEGQANPVAYSYADGEYWDDTTFPIHPAGRKVRVTVYFQTTSKEYIEFLESENTTNDAGSIAYDQWVLGGKSEPVAMASVTRRIPPFHVREVLARVPLDGKKEVVLDLPNGETQGLALDAGRELAGAPFLVIGSTSGTEPGFRLGASAVPLNFDAYTRETIARPNEVPLYGSSGFLDEQGRATVWFSVPAGTPLDAVAERYSYVFAYADAHGNVRFSEPVTLRPSAPTDLSRQGL